MGGVVLGLVVGHLAQPLAMRWFPSIALRAPRSKVQLIRDLVLERMRRAEFEPPEFDIRKVPDEILLGQPESTIVVCAETYAHALRDGATSEEALAIIESIRFTAGSVDPEGKGISQYVYERVRLEHGPLPGLDLDFVADAVDKSLIAFGVRRI